MNDTSTGWSDMYCRVETALFLEALLLDHPLYSGAPSNAIGEGMDRTSLMSNDGRHCGAYAIKERNIPFLPMLVSTFFTVPLYKVSHLPYFMENHQNGIRRLMRPKLCTTASTQSGEKILLHSAMAPKKECALYEPLFHKEDYKLFFSSLSFFRRPFWTIKPIDWSISFRAFGRRGHEGGWRRRFYQNALSLLFSLAYECIATVGLSFFHSPSLKYLRMGFCCSPSETP